MHANTLPHKTGLLNITTNRAVDKYIRYQYDSWMNIETVNFRWMFTPEMYHKWIFALAIRSRIHGTEFIFQHKAVWSALSCYVQHNNNKIKNTYRNIEIVTLNKHRNFRFTGWLFPSMNPRLVITSLNVACIESLISYKLTHFWLNITYS
jgi:hypothetical protein